MQYDVKELLNAQTQQFIAMGGLQGAGKSTIVGEFEAKGYKVVCPDRLRVELAKKIAGNEDKFESELDDILQDQSRKAWLIADRQVKKFLSEGFSVIFDATLINRKARKQVIEWSQATGVPASIIFIDCPVEIAIQRNLKRSQTVVARKVSGEPVYGRYVPENVIQDFAKRQAVPTKDEGFKSVHIVKVK